MPVCWRFLAIFLLALAVLPAAVLAVDPFNSTSGSHEAENVTLVAIGFVVAGAGAYCVADKIRMPNSSFPPGTSEYDRYQNAMMNIEGYRTPECLAKQAGISEDEARKWMGEYSGVGLPLDALDMSDFVPLGGFITAPLKLGGKAVLKQGGKIAVKEAAGDVTEILLKQESKAALRGTAKELPMLDNIIKNLDRYGIEVLKKDSWLAKRSKITSEKVNSLYSWRLKTLVYGKNTLVGQFFHELVHVKQHIAKGLKRTSFSLEEGLQMEREAYKNELANAENFGYSQSQIKQLKNLINGIEQDMIRRGVIP